MDVISFTKAPLALWHQDFGSGLNALSLLIALFAQLHQDQEQDRMDIIFVLTDALAYLHQDYGLGLNVLSLLIAISAQLQQDLDVGTRHRLYAH